MTFKSNGSYLEDYLESVVHLPIEIKRNFGLMRELDQNQHKLLGEMNLLQREYISKTRKKVNSKKNDCLTSEALRKLAFDKEGLNAINQIKLSAITKSDEKVAIAAQTYDLVDNYIRELDVTIKKFEAELRDTGEWSSSNETDLSINNRANTNKRNNNKNSINNKSGKAFSNTSVSYDGSNQKKSNSGVAHNSSGNTSSLLYQTEDLPVDPSEPVYCLCRRVSYGEMVGCDDDECLVEWFHYGCVGLKEKPKGTWYCPDCTKRRQKKRR